MRLLELVGHSERRTVVKRLAAAVALAASLVLTGCSDDSGEPRGERRSPDVEQETTRDETTSTTSPGVEVDDIRWACGSGDGPAVSFDASAVEVTVLIAEVKVDGESVGRRGFEVKDLPATYVLDLSLTDAQYELGEGEFQIFGFDREPIVTEPIALRFPPGSGGCG